MVHRNSLPSNTSSHSLTSNNQSATRQSSSRTVQQSSSSSIVNPRSSSISSRAARKPSSSTTNPSSLPPQHLPGGKTLNPTTKMDTKYNDKSRSSSSSSSTTVPIPHHRLPPPYPNSREQSQILISHYEQEESYQTELQNQLRYLQEENQQLEAQLRSVQEETEQYRIRVGSEQGKHLLDQQRMEEAQNEIRTLENQLVQQYPSQIEEAKREANMIIKDIAQRELLLEMQRDKRERLLLEELLAVQAEIEDQWTQVHALETELGTLVFSEDGSHQHTNSEGTPVPNMQYYTAEINDLQHSILLCSGPDGIHRLQRGVKEAKITGHKTKRKYQDELYRWRNTCAELSARKERLRLAKETLLDKLDSIGIASPRTLKQLANSLRHSLDTVGNTDEDSSITNSADTENNDDLLFGTIGLRRSSSGYSPSGPRFAWDEWTTSETEASPQLNRNKGSPSSRKYTSSPKQSTNSNTGGSITKPNWINDALAAVKRGKYRAALSSSTAINPMDNDQEFEPKDDDNDDDGDFDTHPQQQQHTLPDESGFQRPSRSRARSFVVSKLLGQNNNAHHHNTTHPYPTGRRHRTRSSTSPLHQPKHIAQIGTGSNPNPWNLRKYPNTSPSTMINSSSPSQFSSSLNNNNRQLYSSLEHLEQKTSSLLLRSSSSSAATSPSPIRGTSANKDDTAVLPPTNRQSSPPHNISSNEKAYYTRPHDQKVSPSVRHYQPLPSHRGEGYFTLSSSSDPSSFSSSLPMYTGDDYSSPVPGNMTNPTIAYTATLANDAHTLDPSGRSVSKTKRGAQFDNETNTVPRGRLQYHDTNASMHYNGTSLRTSLSPSPQGGALSAKGIPSHSEARARSRVKLIPNDIRSSASSSSSAHPHDSITASPTATAVTRHINQLRQSESTKDMKLKARENAWGRKTNNNSKGSYPVKPNNVNNNNGSQSRSVSREKMMHENNFSSTTAINRNPSQFTTNYRAATSSALWAQLDLPVSSSSTSFSESVPAHVPSTSDDALEPYEKTIGNTTEADEIRKLLEQLVFHHEQAQDNEEQTRETKTNHRIEETIGTSSVFRNETSNGPRSSSPSGNGNRPKSISPERIAQLANPKQPIPHRSIHRRQQATPGKGLLRSNFSLLDQRNNNNNNSNVFDYAQDKHSQTQFTKPSTKRVSFRSPSSENNNEPLLSTTKLISSSSVAASGDRSTSPRSSNTNDDDNSLYTRLAQPKERNAKKTNNNDSNSNFSTYADEPFVERHKVLQAYDKSLRGTAANGAQISPRSSRAEDAKRASGTSRQRTNESPKNASSRDSIDTSTAPSSSTNELSVILDKAAHSLHHSTTVPLVEPPTKSKATDTVQLIAEPQVSMNKEKFLPQNTEDVQTLLDQVHRLSTKVTENKLRNDKLLTNLYLNGNNLPDSSPISASNNTTTFLPKPRSRTPPRPTSSSPPFTTVPPPTMTTTTTPPTTAVVPSSYTEKHLRRTSLNNNSVPVVPLLGQPPLPLVSSSSSSIIPSSSSSVAGYVYGGGGGQNNKKLYAPHNNNTKTNSIVSTTLDKELVHVPDALKPMVESALMEALEHAFAKALKNEQ